MADRSHPIQVQVHSHQQPHKYDPRFKAQLGGPSKAQVLAVLTLLPTGAALLGLSGLALFFSLVGLALAIPAFIICSPVLVPAAIATVAVLAGLLASGTFGITGLSSLSWVFQYFRQASEAVPEQVEAAKRGMHDVAIQMGQKTKEAGQAIEKKAQEASK